REKSSKSMARPRRRVRRLREATRPRRPAARRKDAPESTSRARATTNDGKHPPWDASIENAGKGRSASSAATFSFALPSRTVVASACLARESQEVHGPHAGELVQEIPRIERSG